MDGHPVVYALWVLTWRRWGVREVPSSCVELAASVRPPEVCGTTHPSLDPEKIHSVGEK